jgi:proteasome accessory factor A
LQERIFGTESEYALFFHAEGQKGLAWLGDEDFLEHLKAVTSLLPQALSTQGRPFAGEFLGNGGRFYLDRGGHPEYATPECRAVRDLVIHEKAGDHLAQALVESVRDLLAASGRPAVLHLFKNNVDAFGNSYGAHENYLVTPAVMQRIPAILPFFVTRQIFTGAGKVSRGGAGEAPYQVSQRADFLDRVYSDRTREVRGIINTRKREIPKYGHNLRLHLIFGDANLSEYALRLKFGTTALVLRLLEEGALEDFPVLHHPVQAVKKISARLDALFSLEGKPGKYTALDLQRLYLEKAQGFFSSRRPQPDEIETLTLWETTLEGLDGLAVSWSAGVLEADPGDLRRWLDWLLKLWLLNRAQQQHSFSWNDPRARLLDMKYHDLDAETGLFARCLSLGLTDRLVRDDEVLRAQSEPPRDTRAWLRGQIIRCARGKEVELHIKDWEKINLTTDWQARKSDHFFDRTRRLANRLKIKLEDPFQSEAPEILASVQAFLENC